MDHTKLPWVVEHLNSPRVGWVDDLGTFHTICQMAEFAEYNAAYIVQACNAYPRLCEVLRELVEAADEQQDGLDPTVRLVQAMRDAKSWVDSPALSSSSPKET